MSAHSRTFKGVRTLSATSTLLAIDAQETFAQHRLIDDAQHRHAVMLQRDQRTPFMPPE